MNAVLGTPASPLTTMQDTKSDFTTGLPTHPPYYSERLRQGCDLSVPFYGQWAPRVMRGLQDQFGMRMGHLVWIQNLLIGADVPLHRPLTADEITPELAAELTPMVLNHTVGKSLIVSSGHSERPELDLFEYDQKVHRADKVPLESVLAANVCQVFSYPSPENSLFFEPEADDLESQLIDLQGVELWACPSQREPVKSEFAGREMVLTSADPVFSCAEVPVDDVSTRIYADDENVDADAAHFDGSVQETKPTSTRNIATPKSEVKISFDTDINDLLDYLFGSFGTVSEDAKKPLKFVLSRYSESLVEITAQIGEEKDRKSIVKLGKGRTVLLQVIDAMRQFCIYSPPMRCRVRWWGLFVATELLGCGRKVSIIIEALTQKFLEPLADPATSGLSFSPTEALQDRLFSQATDRNGLLIPFVCLSLCRNSGTELTDFDAVFGMKKDTSVGIGAVVSPLKTAKTKKVAPKNDESMILPSMPGITKTSWKRDLADVVDTIFSGYEDGLDPSAVVRFTLSPPVALVKDWLEITMHCGASNSISKIGKGPGLMRQVLHGMRQLSGMRSPPARGEPQYQRIVRRWALTVSTHFLGCGKKIASKLTALTKLVNVSRGDQPGDLVAWFDTNLDGVVADLVAENFMLLPFLCLSLCRNSGVTVQDLSYVMNLKKLPAKSFHLAQRPSCQPTASLPNAYPKGGTEKGKPVLAEPVLVEPAKKKVKLVCSSGRVDH